MVALGGFFVVHGYQTFEVDVGFGDSNDGWVGEIVAGAVLILAGLGVAIGLMAAVIAGPPPGDYGDPQPPQR